MSFNKDLAHITWDEVRKRQLQRFDLVWEWIELTSMRNGSSLVEIGSGTGVFVAEYAKIVGENGRIWAVEKSQEAIAILQKEIENVPWGNVVVIQRNAEDALDDLNSPDIIILTDILHHTESPENVLRNVYKVAGPTTRVLIGEFDPNSKGDFGPPLKDRIEESTLGNITHKLGFETVARGKQNHEHYFLLLQKS